MKKFETISFTDLQSYQVDASQMTLYSVGGFEHPDTSWSETYISAFARRGLRHCGLALAKA